VRNSAQLRATGYAGLRGLEKPGNFIEVVPADSSPDGIDLGVSLSRLPIKALRIDLQPLLEGLPILEWLFLDDVG
jgi:hypothetical protein